MNYAIIAAGEGSRLVNEGIFTPKPLICIGGERMIDRLIRIFMANDAESINVIVNLEMREVYEHLRLLRVPVPLNIIHKSTPSSMHSFYELSPALGNARFCLTTVDTIFREEEFAQYIRAFKHADIDGLMAVTDYIEDEKPLYVETDEHMTIHGFHDENCTGSHYISGGIYGLNNKCLPILRDAVAEGMSRLRNYQRQLVKCGLKLKAWPFSKIIDVDHPEDIRKAEDFLNSTGASPETTNKDKNDKKNDYRDPACIDFFS
ncbi:MAG: NTP transferase domain-containing protein [Tannerella sp.]|jgi:NDP-sugar pyrophosphorylase family protein|nr:NTP transferase domain-containing protein [Tannerella sp.]